MRPFRQRLEAAWTTMPPSPGELLVATLAGGSALALANALDIAATVRFAGVGLRLRHHLVDAVLCLGGAAWVGIVVATLARARKLAWPAIYAASAVAMTYVLGRQLLRQANVPFESELRHVLVVIYVALASAAVPAAYLCGALLARLGWRSAGAVLGAVGIALGHLVLRDDYPGVHTAILWVAATVLGASLAPSLLARRRVDRRQTVVLAWLAAATLVPPRNDVRCELFRQPGGVVPWVLARLWWSPPPVEQVAEAPRLVPVGDEAFAEARWGLAEEPLVVLVSIDAARADVIASGRFDDRLPVLARLRDQGVFFSHAVAPGSQTSVSLTSVFSGRHFSFLRWAYHGRGRSRFHYAAGDPAVRFPALLTDDGVKTASVLPLTFLAAEYGVTGGFAEERVVGEGRGHAPAVAVMTPLLQRIRRHRGRAFFYAHLTEPHEPYDRATTEGPAFERYVAEIALVDHWLGRLVPLLSRHRGYLIVTADHGEAFGEHGRYFHTKSLYEEMVAVPLILWGPGIARRRIDRVVSLIDLGPTVLHLFGRKPPEGMLGRSLLPLARGVEDAHPSPVFAEGRLQRAYWRSDGIKVIEDTERKTLEVYDLVMDPGETQNLFATDPRAESAVAELRAFFAVHALPDYEPPFKP